jgi:hypothetical protein
MQKSNLVPVILIQIILNSKNKRITMQKSDSMRHQQTSAKLEKGISKVSQAQ